jgi:hypothetical protein
MLDMPELGISVPLSDIYADLVLVGDEPDSE